MKSRTYAYKRLLVLVSLFAAAACGVRGRPQPPLTPAELGRGQPTFKRSTEEYAFPNVPAPETEPSPAPAPTPTPKPRSIPHGDGR